MTTRAEDNDCPPGEFGEYFPEALEQAVRKFDPIHRAEAFADRPLLMLNGAEDTLVPPDCNRRFEAAARPHYRHPERLRLSVYDGVGHAVPREMWEEASNWLRRWLLEESSF